MNDSEVDNEVDSIDESEGKLGNIESNCPPNKIVNFSENREVDIDEYNINDEIKVVDNDSAHEENDEFFDDTCIVDDNSNNEVDSEIEDDYSESDDNKSDDKSADESVDDAEVKNQGKVII